MTDDQQTPAASEPLTDDVFADAFDEWIGGSNFAKRSVLVFSKPGLMAEYEDLLRRKAYIADEDAAAQAAGEESLGEVSPHADELAEIDERIREIAVEYEASKSTWVVRGLSDADREHVEKTLEAAGFREPDQPKQLREPAPLPAQRTPTQVKAHEKAVAQYKADKPRYDAEIKAYGEAVHAWSIELNTHILERAVVSIDFGNDRTVEATFIDGVFAEPAITVEQLKRLRDRLGQKNLTNLLQAAQLAELEEPDIQAPFSSSSSQTDQT